MVETILYWNLTVDLGVVNMNYYSLGDRGPMCSPVKTFQTTFSSLFGLKTKTSPKFRITHKASNEENVPMSWLHHVSWSLITVEAVAAGQRPSQSLIPRQGKLNRWLIKCIGQDISNFGRTVIEWNHRNQHLDGLVQNCSNPSALAMGLLQFCTKPSICRAEFISWT